MSVFIYILMIEKSYKSGYLQHSSSKGKGEKISCNHLTSALCKPHQELGTANIFLHENTLFFFFFFFLPPFPALFLHSQQ